MWHRVTQEALTTGPVLCSLGAPWGGAGTPWGQVPWLTPETLVMGS